MLVRESLFELKEKEYADFQSRLVPNISREHFIGVRIPKIRSLAKKYPNIRSMTGVSNL